MQHVIFVEKERTADFQTTKGLLDILSREGNQDDIFAFIMERNLPLSEADAWQLAEKILKKPPTQGYLTVSPLCQWPFHYSRAIQKGCEVSVIAE